MDKSNVAFTFNSPKVITKVVQLGGTNHGPISIQLGANTFTHPLTDDGPGTIIYTTGSNNVSLSYIEINGPWSGITDMISYRDRTDEYALFIAKFIALGYDCTDASL